MENHKTGILCFSTRSWQTGQEANQHLLVEIPYHITYLDKKTDDSSEAFLDNPKISQEDNDTLLSNLKSKQIIVNSAQPSSGEIMNGLEILKGQGVEEIVIITPSEKLTPVINPAGNAAQDFYAEQGIPVTVEDSRVISAPEGFVVREAYKLAESGATAEKIVRSIPLTAARTCIDQVFSSLYQLRKNGRIGKAKYLVAGILSKNALITLKEGLLEPIDSIRGWEQANTAAIEYLAKFAMGKTVELAIVYYGVSEEQLQRSEYIARNTIKNIDSKTLFKPQSCVLVAHSDIGTIGYSVFEKD
ncbi:MAG TPA: DegV family protein [Patescibacteria group bacterium]|nr:DegV family protein [Patescibacteria group bacterium]